jgi:hypothetical protein
MQCIATPPRPSSGWAGEKAWIGLHTSRGRSNVFSRSGSYHRPKIPLDGEPNRTERGVRYSSRQNPIDGPRRSSNRHRGSGQSSARSFASVTAATPCHGTSIKPTKLERNLVRAPRRVPRQGRGPLHVEPGTSFAFQIVHFMKQWIYRVENDENTIVKPTNATERIH